MEIYIIRHGETVWNAKKLLQGSTDIELNENGRELAGITVRLLRQGDPGCEVIITSHDPRYEVEGATRYEPVNNHLELDRFTE